MHGWVVGSVWERRRKRVISGDSWLVFVVGAYLELDKWIGIEL
jgi:hypothetical protein